jgi:hypothetical protein
MGDILNSAVVPDASLGNEPSTLVATPDPYGGNPIVTEMPWGVGAQDMMYAQDPSSVTSTADVLRPTVSPDGSPLIDYGQTPYVPPADPIISTGSIDWSQLGDGFKSFATGIAGVATAFSPLMSGHANLAGAGGGVSGTPGARVPGNPGPGGQAGTAGSGAGQLRLPGGVTLPTGTLLYVGLGLALVYLVLRGGHR